MLYELSPLLILFDFQCAPDSGKFISTLNRLAIRTRNPRAGDSDIIEVNGLIPPVKRNHAAFKGIILGFDNLMDRIKALSSAFFAINLTVNRNLLRFAVCKSEWRYLN